MYPSFISKIFQIEINIILHVKNSHYANSDLDVDIVVGGNFNHISNINNSEVNNINEVNESQFNFNHRAGDCILFVSKFELLEDDKNIKPFSKINYLYKKKFISSEFQFVNQECIWKNYFNSLQYSQRIHSCTPTVDFFALYTKGLSYSPELVFDEFKINISIRPNQHFLKTCGSLCDSLIDFLKEHDVSYTMPSTNQIVLDENVLQKFTRRGNFFTMELPRIGNFNDLIFNCKK